MSETRRLTPPPPPRPSIAQTPPGTSLFRTRLGTSALALLLAAGPTAAQDPPAKPVPRGPDSSLTLLPVRLGGRPFDRITEVAGLLLEQRGLRNIELGGTPPDVPPGADLDGLATAVSAFEPTGSGLDYQL